MIHPDSDELRLWARGALAGPAGERIAEHVAGCLDCRITISEEARLDRLLQLDPEPVIPAESVRDAARRIDALLHRERDTARRRLRSTAYAVAALGTIVAAIVTTPARPPKPFESTLHGVVREVELEAAKHLAALQTLVDSPWVADDLETVLALQGLEADEQRHVAKK